MIKKKKKNHFCFVYKFSPLEIILFQTYQTLNIETSSHIQNSNIDSSCFTKATNPPSLSSNYI